MKDVNVQKNGNSYLTPTDKRFAHLEIKGSYQEIGFQIGRVFRKNIEEIIKRRTAWHRGLIDILNSEGGRKLSDKLLNLSKKHFPNVIEEMRGIADGAGIDFDFYWAMSIKSELGVLQKEPPGCSTIFVRNEHHIWLAHNEDGHRDYHDILFTLKVTPPSGVAFISLVYPGIPAGSGPSFNNRGIIQTTNFIPGRKSEIGVPRYVIGRAVLEAKDLKEAIQLATFEERAYPFHHNIASMDEKQYASVETTPETFEVRHPKGIYFHTNHLIFEKTINNQPQNQVGNPLSSLSRYIVISEKIKQIEPGDIQVKDILSILSAHERKPYSPCRHPQGKISGRTLCTAFFDIGEGTFRLYKGNPCEAVKKDQVITLGF